MARDLRLEVILAAVDKATRPIRAIMQGSAGLARQLKDTRDQLKSLNAQQKDIAGFRALKGASEQTNAALQASQDRVKSLAREISASGAPTRQMNRDFARAVRESQALKQKHTEQQQSLQQLRSRLTAAGISTSALATHERELRRKITQTNESISQQGKRLERLTVQTRNLAKARAAFDNSQQVAGGMAAAGAAGVGTAYAISRPLGSIVNAFAPAEDAATQLKGSMMASDGSVSADFEKITQLANQLGDRLPGTTADFQAMMTMLRRQGLSATSILGGTSEAAAYLGVQLKMPVEASAEFAAKMQDATRTAEKDMLALMDTIQRAYYIGVDSGNMLQGFSKLSPVMGIIKQEGVEAANTLAPLLVMMDQTGMAGESAGNAIRKVFQSGMNTKKFGKANEVLEELKAGFNLDFTNGKGEFGGLDNLFTQLEKLKRLTSVERTSVMAALFGDDSETLQTVNTMMNKGMAGYREVAAKMQDQADLRTRVNQQLGTLTNTIEAAQGSWTNAMAEVGAAVAPELKRLISWTGEIAVKVGTWARENPELVATLVKVAAGIAGVAAAGGALAIAMAGFLGPLAMARYGLSLLNIKGATLIETLFGTRAAADHAAEGADLLSRLWGGLSTEAGNLAERLKESWLESSPSEMIDKAKELSGQLKSSATAAWEWSKAAGPRLSASIKQAAQSTWAYTTGPLRAVARGTANATRSVMANIRANGLLGASYNLARGGVIGMWGVLRGGVVGALGSMASGVRLMGQAFLFAGRALLLNPIGLLITAIAVAALLIYKYWGPIKAFVSGFWQGLMEGVAPIKEALLPAFAAMGVALAPLQPIWASIASVIGTVWGWLSKLFEPLQSTSQELKNATDSGRAFGLWLAGLINLLADLTGKMFGFGANLIGGLINGIKSMGGQLKGAITGAGDSTINWFKERLGIHSPSRVFAELGGFTMAGLTQGLAGGEDGPLAQIGAFTRRLTQAGALALGVGAMPAMANMAPLSVDNRPPISAGAAGQAISIGGDTITITINGASGSSADLAQQISRVMDERERTKAARIRSRLHDQE